MGAPGHVFSCFVDYSTIWADIIDIGVPKQELTVGAALTQYLLGDKDPEHFWVARNRPMKASPPDGIELGGLDDTFDIEKSLGFGSSPMFLEGCFRWASELLSICMNLEIFQGEHSIKVLV
jgi:hypothetical protein